MKEIPLTQGKFALVDDEDFDRINQWKWCYRQGYAIRGVNLGKRKVKTIQMHTLIIGTPKGMTTDHINGNKIDNRRSNLRICTQKQNTKNRQVSKKIVKSSTYKGVSWHKQNKKWQANIKVNYHHIYLGTFKTENEAARAYDTAATKHFGEFARLNAA